jgi:phage terminase Nu1 subunit (DNA packaging protein)
MSRKTKKSVVKKNATAFADAELVKTQRLAGRYAGVSERTIRRWVEAGMPRTGAGYYFRAMLDVYKTNEGSQPTRAKKRKEEASAEKTEWQAAKLKRELEIEQGKLVRIDDEYLRNEVRRHMAVNRSLNGLSRKVLGRLPEKIRRIVRPVLKEEVDNILDAFAEGRTAGQK